MYSRHFLNTVKHQHVLLLCKIPCNTSEDLRPHPYLVKPFIYVHANLLEDMIYSY